MEFGGSMGSSPFDGMKTTTPDTMSDKNLGFDWASLMKNAGGMGDIQGGSIGQILAQIMQGNRGPKTPEPGPNSTGANASPTTIGATPNSVGPPKPGETQSPGNAVPPNIMQMLMQYMQSQGQS